MDNGHWTDHPSTFNGCSAGDKSAFSNFDQGNLPSPVLLLLRGVWEHWPLIATASSQALKLKTPPSHKAVCRIMFHNMCVVKIGSDFLGAGTRIPN